MTGPDGTTGTAAETRGASLPLAVTMGDPAGIGGDLTLTAWVSRQSAALPCFAALDDPDRLRALALRLGLTVPVEEISDLGDAAGCFGRALPVLPVRLNHPVSPGCPDSRHTQAVLESIEQAVALCQSGQAGAVVTQPINKKVLQDGGFLYPGHTEYLAALATPDGQPPVTPVMMLACPSLRVVPITIHQSLLSVGDTLTEELIVRQALITAVALRTFFALPAPRLAFAGLNPHAGENGAMGTEEQTIILPALERLKAMGMTVSGPHPADTLFHAEARAAYDVALCMYHDQALIPIKTLDFHGGVNVTLGLPFIRTSPDHGTAYALAGTGQANPSSFRAALTLAARMAAQRVS